MAGTYEKISFKNLGTVEISAFKLRETKAEMYDDDVGATELRWEPGQTHRIPSTASKAGTGGMRMSGGDFLERPDSGKENKFCGLL